MRRSSASPFFVNPSPFRSPRYAYPVFSPDPYYRSYPDHTNPSPSPFDHSPRPRNRKPSVINVPVSDASSSPSLGSRSAVSHRMDPISAATKIQACFRGFSVRHRKPLLHLRTIAAARLQLNDLSSQLKCSEFSARVRSSTQERLRFNESVMALLLKLDAVEGAIPEVRLQRKEAIKMAVQLQDSLDSLLQCQQTESGDKLLVDAEISIQDEDMAKAILENSDVGTLSVDGDAILVEPKQSQNGDVSMVNNTAKMEACGSLSLTQSSSIHAVLEVPMDDPVVHCTHLEDHNVIPREHLDDAEVVVHCTHLEEHDLIPREHLDDTEVRSNGQNASEVPTHVDDGNDLFEKDTDGLAGCEIQSFSGDATGHNEREFSSEDQDDVFKGDASGEHLIDEDASENTGKASEMHIQEDAVMRVDEYEDVMRVDEYEDTEKDVMGDEILVSQSDIATEKHMHDETKEDTGARVQGQLKFNELENNLLQGRLKSNEQENNLLVCQVEDERCEAESAIERTTAEQRLIKLSPENELADCQDRELLKNDLVVDSGLDCRNSIETTKTIVPVKSEVSSSDDGLLQQLSEDCKQLRSLLGKLLLESSLQNRVIIALGKRLERLEKQQFSSAKKRAKGVSKREKMN